MILMKLLTSSSATVDALARASEKGGYYDTPYGVYVTRDKNMEVIYDLLL